MLRQVPALKIIVTCADIEPSGQSQAASSQALESAIRTIKQKRNSSVTGNIRTVACKIREQQQWGARGIARHRDQRRKRGAIWRQRGQRCVTALPQQLTRACNWSLFGHSLALVWFHMKNGRMGRHLQFCLRGC
jgi:hypothetical protein